MWLLFLGEAHTTIFTLKTQTMKPFYKTILLLFCVLGLKLSAQTAAVNMGDVINTSFAENGPKISPDGKTLYFWRWRDQDEKSKNYGHDIYKSELNETGNWDKATKMEKPFNTGSYNAVECVGRNGNTLLLHGTFSKKKAIGTGFSISTKTNKTWSTPENLIVKDLELMQLGKYYNGTLSNDGTVLILCFSEIKGGEENDLYVSFKQTNGTWSRPKHMGNTVNSAFSEASPFISSDGANLYFSSNRPGGTGCFDIYRTTRKDTTWENWTEPQNLGSTINSPVCDIHFSIDAKEEYAYLGTYNNSQFGGEDIVKVKLVDSLKPKKNIVIMPSDAMFVQAKTDSSIQNLIQQPHTDAVIAADVKNTDSYIATTFSVNNFIIYPNPTDENFFLELTGTYSQNLTVTIMDGSGKILTTELINHLDGIYTKRFDVSEYAKGMYFVTITDGVSMASKRLVIQ